MSLEQIQAAFASISRSYCCSGTIPLSSDMSTLFYNKNGTAEAINFASPTDTQLVGLAETCQPATFGLKDKDVLDESYRKAGKLDPKDFSLQFSPLSTGVVSIVSQNLLKGRLHDTETSIRVELYKLNVYGPGSFFKAHVDTPRGDHMFGSLVIVLPTEHEGGSLILRHDGKETVFDTAQSVKSKEAPHAAFVAFFSDVEHEVALVTSGYRVTVTYNLYLTAPIIEEQKLGPELNSTGTGAGSQQIAELQKSLEKLLDDPTFLPQGGLLGFCLSHKYPFKPNAGFNSTSHLRNFANRLKGSDAEVKRVCHAIGLDVKLKALYTENTPGDGNPCCLFDDFVIIEEAIQREEINYLKYIFMQAGENPIVAYPSGEDADEDWIREEGKPIVWLRPFNQANLFSSSYAAYGNEATMDTAYGDVCLVAEVNSAEERIGSE